MALPHIVISSVGKSSVNRLSTKFKDTNNNKNEKGLFIKEIKKQNCNRKTRKLI